MRTIGYIIFLISLAMIVLVGAIAAEDIFDEVSGNNKEATVAGNVISPILTVMGFLSSLSAQ